MKTKIKFYRYPDFYNVGDTLAKPILEKLLPLVKFEEVNEKEKGKLLSIGSVMSKALNNDIIWGTGCIRNKPIKISAKFLAVRGKLTRSLIIGSKVPEVYGDPALLLPLIYNPVINKIKKIGYIPHYVDKPLFKEQGKDFIDVALPWKEFINKVLECESIVSSSLHGIVIAEAYGIPATWAVYSDKVIGNGFKFKDYLTGTGRKEQEPGQFPPIENLKEIQNNLLSALREYIYGDK